MPDHISKIPTVLSIAGSDPSGGAGIQADLKTFMAAGVYGAAVITALTAQNTTAVDAAMPVPADFVEQQLISVLSDIRIDAIKLGMLPNREVCEKIAPHLSSYATVCDPVMVSTSGHQLIDDQAIRALTDHVIPASDFLTPNLAELEILYQAPPKNIEAAGHALLEKFPNLKGIALKGGHAQAQNGDITDRFVFRGENGIATVAESHRYVRTQNTHGTGCTFSSFFAAYLAKNHSPAGAFRQAVQLTAHLIEISTDHGIGQGHGPLLHHAATEEHFQ